MNFVNKVASGQNLQQAALSSAGNLIYKKIQQQTGSLRLPGIGAAKLPQVSTTFLKGLPRGVPARAAFGAGLALAKGNAAAQAAMKAAQARSRIPGIVPKASLAWAVPSPAIGRAFSAARPNAAGMKPIPNLPVAKAAQAIIPARPSSTKSGSTLSTDARGDNGIAAFPGGPSAQGGFNACMASARRQCLEKAGFTGDGPVLAKPSYAADKVAPGQWVAPGSPTRSTAAAGSQAAPKSSPGDRYTYPPMSVADIPSPDKLAESGQLPPAGKWFKRNGQLLVSGAYA
jgi:hypothetical protein